MKHIKSYHLFESKEVIMASIKNAIDNNNVDLYNDIVDQYSEFIDYKDVTDLILNWRGNYHFLKNIGSQNLTHVKYLDIRHKDITTLKDIKYLTSLEELDCDECGLTSLEGIESLTKLKILHCGVNELTSLKGVENLKNLEQIQCSEQPINNLEHIVGLDKLVRITCFEIELTGKLKEIYDNIHDDDVAKSYLEKNNDGGDPWWRTAGWTDGKYDDENSLRLQLLQEKWFIKAVKEYYKNNK